MQWKKNSDDFKIQEHDNCFICSGFIFLKSWLICCVLYTTKGYLLQAQVIENKLKLVEIDSK